MKTEEPDEHLYNNHGQSNERFRKMIDQSLERNQSVRLHQHSQGQQCNAGCVTYAPAGYDE